MLSILHVQKQIKSMKSPKRRFSVFVQQQLFVLRTELALILPIILHTDLRFARCMMRLSSSVRDHECKLHFSVYFVQFCLSAVNQSYLFVPFPGTACNERTYWTVYSPIYLDHPVCNSLSSGDCWNKSKVAARTSASFTESLESRDPTESALKPCRCLLASSLMATWGMWCSTYMRMVLICANLFICCMKLKCSEQLVRLAGNSTCLVCVCVGGDTLSATSITTFMSYCKAVYCW